MPEHIGTCILCSKVLYDMSEFMEHGYGICKQELCFCQGGNWQVLCDEWCDDQGIWNYHHSPSLNAYDTF